MMSFGSGQGRSDFEAAGVETLRRGNRNYENACMGQKTTFM
jgi:hypothetical protein